MDYSTPFIHLFSSPRNNYFYDVNKDSIVPISLNEYKFLEGEIQQNTLSDDEVKHLENLESMGYLSKKRFSKIIHPATDSVEYHVLNRAEQLILQVTQSCNLICSYCPYANKTDGVLQRNHSSKAMNWETAKKAIDIFRDNSTDTDKLSIGFYGGEPLIAFPLIKKAVEYAEKLFEGKEINFSMTTNGTLMTDEIIEYIVSHQMTIMFSIDGPAKIHDISRKKADGSGSFESAFSNLKKLIAVYGERYHNKIFINMVLNPDNNIDETLELFDDDLFKQYDIITEASLAEDDKLEKKIEKKEAYTSSMRYQYFLGFLNFLGLVDDINTALIVRRYFNDIERKYERYKNKLTGLTDVGAPGGPCIPGQRKLFVNADGVYYPCEKISELSNVMQIGTIDSGFDFEKIRTLLNVGSITSEKCKNCYALLHCKLCAIYADGYDSLSVDQKLKNCYVTLNSFDDELEACVLIKECRTIYNRERK